MNNHELTQMFNDFKNLDTDRSGDLGEEEMQRAYAASCNGEVACTQEAHNQAVQAIRSLKNADGKIDLAAYIRWRRGYAVHDDGGRLSKNRGDVSR